MEARRRKPKRNQSQKSQLAKLRAKAQEGTKGAINLEQDLELLTMCLDNSQEMGAILCSLFSQLAQRYRQTKNVIFLLVK